VLAVLNAVLYKSFIFKVIYILFYIFSNWLFAKNRAFRYRKFTTSITNSTRYFYIFLYRVTSRREWIISISYGIQVWPLLWILRYIIFDLYRDICMLLSVQGCLLANRQLSAPTPAFYFFRVCITPLQLRYNRYYIRVRFIVTARSCCNSNL